jgi:plasmid maintenance system antidote protein VapI
VTRRHLDRIVDGRARITAGTAARIAAALGATTPEYWLNLQNAVEVYDTQRRLEASSNPLQLIEIAPSKLAARKKREGRFAREKMLHLHSTRCCAGPVNFGAVRCGNSLSH